MCATVCIGEASLDRVKPLTSIVEQANARVLSLHLRISQQVGAYEISAAQADIEIEHICRDSNFLRRLRRCSRRACCRRNSGGSRDLDSRAR